MKRLDVNMKVLIAIILFFGISLSLMAQPQQRQRQRQAQVGNHGGLAILNLTDDQKADIKEIHLAQIKETQPLMDEVKVNRAKINAALHKDNPDMKEIVSLVEANGKLLTDIQVQKIESQVKIRSLLTDEQKLIHDSHAGRRKNQRAIAQHRMARMDRMQKAHRMERMQRPVQE